VAPPHVLVIEPSAHHISFTRDVCEAFSAAGARVTLLTTPSASAAARDSVADVVGDWPESPRPMSSPRNPLERLLNRARAAARFYSHGAVAKRILERTLHRTSPTHVVMTTSSSMDLHALAIADTRGLPTVAVLYDPPRGRADRIALRRAASQTNRALRIGTITSSMRDLYVAAGADPRGVVIVPNPSLGADRIGGPPRRLDTAPLTYVGNARREKGFDFFAGAIPSLLDAGFRVTVQSYLRGDEEPGVVDAARSLSDLQSDGLKVVHGPVSDDEYAALLHDALAIVLPYRPEDYGQGRTSGILPEAWAYGVPVVVSDGWWGADEVRTHGAGTVFQFGDLASLMHAAKQLEDDAPGFSSQARVAHRAMSTTAGADAFCAWVLGMERASDVEAAAASAPEAR
jgi:glycosyltransferase involved in cell wall biosynthesis